MAQALVKLTCSGCEKEFWHEKSCYSRAEADKYEKWASENITLCPDCFKEQQRKIEKEKKAAETAEFITAYNLPTLSGTPKQIKWAEEIRISKIKSLSPRLEKRISAFKDSGATDKYNAAVEDKELFSWLLSTATDASEWIEFRDNFSEMIKVYKNKKEELQHGVDYTSDEFARYPEASYKPGTVEIAIDGDEIIAQYIKDDDFIQIVKALKYRWSQERHAWVRNINKFSGPIKDRAVELGNKLLEKGFGIRCKDTAVLDAAADADYMPEQDRWISLITDGEYKGWIAISVPTDELYKAARKLPESRWSKPKVAVGINYYKEVIDFAELNDYSLSDGVKKAIEVEKENRDIVKPKKLSIVKTNAEDKLKAILEQGDDIIADLRDDD